MESSDLQAAIQRTQAMERIQALQAQQDERNKKRFELERERESAEKGKKVQDSRAEPKRVVRDHYDGGSGGSSGDDPGRSPEPEEPPRDDESPPEDGTGRKIDVVA